MDKDLRISIVTWIIITIIVIGLMCLSGCRFLQCLGGNAVNTQPESLTYSPLESLKGIVKSSNWLLSVSILGIGISVFALVNGSRWGFAGLAGCLASLVATITVSRYATWMAILGMIGAILLALYTIFIKNKALKEIIKGVQLAKGDFGKQWSERPKAINESQKAVQSNTTKQIVQNTKAELKIKGEI